MSRICPTPPQKPQTGPQSRIQPLIALEYPEYQEELAILRYNVSVAPEDLLELCAGFLSESHKYRLDYSTRDGINIMRYAVRLNQRLGATLEDAFHRAVTQVLGEGAEDFEARAREGIIDDNMVSYESLFGSPDENDEDSDADPDANAGPNNPKGPRNR